MNLSDLITPVRNIARKAGDITLQYFTPDGYESADAKGDGSPVTKADREAEIYIETELLKLAPDIPIIGEESVSGGRKTDTSALDYFWLVDPLDGTREFISGSGEFTVNIALIQNGEAVLGVVYTPAKDDLYASHGPGTAVRSINNKADQPINVRSQPTEGITVVASKRHGDGDKLDQFLEHFKIYEKIGRGSSLKICSIAAGEADLYPRFGPTCEWDIAAAHAILTAAGGILVDADHHQHITYGHNRKNKWLNPEFIASGFKNLR